MKSSILSLIIFASALSALPAQEAPDNEPKKIVPEHRFEYRFEEELKQTDDSLARQDKWFRDAKFGAFIHFGVYSTLEGEYQGRGSEHRYSEWIQVSGKIPADEYRQVAAKFNPSEFNADAWAKVFKDSGIRYVVITSKHHDGFALFKSLVSDYNIVDYTPFKRDLIKELCEACHRQGLKFGVYYSQAQDWDEPDAPFIKPRFNPIRRVIHPDLPDDFQPDMDRYIAKKSLPQVEELVKNYELDQIWFDTPSDMNMERVKVFSDMVRKHRPDCLINSRIIHSGKGKIEAKYLPYYDYVSIGDKEVPDRKLPLYVESPDSVSSSFGYKTKGECYYHTEKELIDRLVGTVCAGGNYLLNNGPMGNGRLDPEAIRLYAFIGQWLKANGESIYATVRNPLPNRPEWGDISASKDGKALYLHVLQWPASGKISITDLPSKATACAYLENGEATVFAQQGETLDITLPAKPINQYDTVIKVSLDVPAKPGVSVTGQSKTAKAAWAKLAGKSVNRPEFAYVENDPALPNVLIYGDSISIMYTERVREKLDGKANVYRLHCNGGDSGSFIAKMEKMHDAMRDESLDQPWSFDWDVIQFNVGLHDLKYLSGRNLDKKNGVQVSSLDVYQKNVTEIVQYLKNLAPDAKLIFATTTPVPGGEPGRVAGDAIKYNQVAQKVLLDHPEIEINDLYRFTEPNQPQWWTKPGDVHYNTEGRNAQGDEVSRIILDSLPN